MPSDATASPTELSPEQARARQRHGALLVDIRDAHERALGQAEGAIAIARQALEDDASAQLPEPGTELVLICQSGQRSLATARRLLAQGYARVASVRGGTSAWQQAGLPVHTPALPADDQDFLQRYARHLRLPQVGIDGQRRLGAARVLLVGAGGLGSPAAFYLAAAGLGHLRLVDDDAVERGNLQRQILHTDDAIGQPKVVSAAHRLQALNPRLALEAVTARVDAGNIAALLDGVDVVIDGADNFATRYLLNDACIAQRKPLVYGAVQQFEGQASVFDAGRQRGHAPCYRCLFPQPPPAAFAPNCSETGVLGVLPGVIGLLQATEALKLLLGIGEPLIGRLLCFDALGMHFHELRLAPDPQCQACGADTNDVGEPMPPPQIAD